MAHQEFRQVFKFPTYAITQWFPGHMYKGLQQMQRTVGQMDCIIEVHDARIPLSGRNPLFKRQGMMRPHILLLNKMDLADLRFRKMLEKDPNLLGVQKVIYTNFVQKFNTKTILSQVLEVVDAAPKFRLDNQTNLMIVGIPNVGKSSLINTLRHTHIKRKGRATSVGAVPGITKSLLERIKISEDPDVYMFDTPGVLTPNVNSSEMALRLAACNAVSAKLVGEEVVADYILFWLNKHKLFKYIDIYDMQEPVDDVHSLLTAISRQQNKFLKRKIDGSYKLFPDFFYAAIHFITLFNKAEFGRINFDMAELRSNFRIDSNAEQELVT